MQYILTGFTQITGFRVFTFEGIAVDKPRTRTLFTVKADLALIRRYGIQIQELPLLCRSLLDHLDDGEQDHTLIFTEEKMRTCANDRAAAREAAASKRRPPRKPPRENLGTAWRVQGAGGIAPATGGPATVAQAFQATGHRNP
jgi:hypothetical protein